MATVQELLVKITGDASGFQQALKETKNAATEIGGAFDAVGTKISGIGTKATAALSVPIVGAATKAVSSFQSVNEQMTLVNATMGTTKSEATMLQNAMTSAASQSVYGMEDAATATLNFARAGLNAKQAASALAPAMNLAAGEGGNLDTVSAGLVATINAFGDSFDNAGKYADVFAVACNNSQLDINSLSNAMSIAAPIFSTMGSDVEECVTSIGIMSNVTNDANVSATALKTGLLRLSAPAKEGAEMMEKLGFSVTDSSGNMKDMTQIQQELHDSFANLSEAEQMEAASAIFGKNQASAWIALINTAPESFQKLENATRQASGTTEEMSKAMMDQNPWLTLKSSIDVLAYSLGGIVTNHLIPFIGKIQEVVDKFNAMSPAQQEQIVKWAGIAAAVGPCLIIFGKVVSGVGGMVTAFGKIGGVIGGVVGHFTKTGGAAKTLAQGVGSAGTATASAATSFGSFAGQALKLAGVAAVVLATAAAVKILADSAISIAQAGPGAAAAFALLVAGGVGMTAAIAAIGSACTATAPGLLALGAAVLMVSTGIAAVTAAIALVVEAFANLVDSVTTLSDKLPLISEYGASAAGGLATLSAAVLALGVACGSAAIPIAALDVTLAAFDVTAGLATPIMAALAASIGLLDVALVGLAASTTLCGTAFETTFNTISSIVSKTVSSVVGFISNLVNKVVGFFKNLKYQLIGDPIVIDMVKGIIKWFGDLVKGVVDFVKGLVEKVVEFFGNLKDKVVETASKLKEKVVEHFNNLKEKVVETVENFKEKVKEKFNAMKEKVVETVNNLKEKAKEHFNSMKEKITETVGNLKDNVQEKFTSIKDKIQEKCSEAKDKAKEKFNELKTAVKEKLTDTVNDVKDKCSSIVDKFKGINLLDIGKDVISGFLNGLKGAWEGVKTWVSNACKNIKNAFKNAMKIGSPSKVFKEYGKFIDQGLVIGLETGEADITRTINSLANGMMNGFTTNLRNTNGVAANNASEGNTQINLNGDYMFQDKESMDYFLNRLGLVLARG